MIKPADCTSLGKANSLLGLQFLSDFGDQITAALLALCVLDITQSTGKVGFIYVFTTLGFVIFTMIGGVLGDAIGRRNILCIADLGRGLAVLLLIFAVREKSIAFIYATSFLLSTLGSIHIPVKVGAWAENIPSCYLERYNSLCELSFQSSTILGPLIASFFVVRNMVSVGFAIDAITFIICAIVFAQIISNKMISSKPVQRRDFLKGFKIIHREWEIKKYVYYDAIQMIGFGAFNATLLVLAQRDFGWSKTQYSYHLTIVAIITTIGALIGAMRITSRIDPNVRLVACAILSALSLYAAIKVQSFPQTAFLVGICDAFIVLTMAIARTRVQLIAKQLYPEHLTSVIAARAITLKSATLFGTGSCLLLEKFVGLGATLTLFTVPIALSCVPIFFGAQRAIPIRSDS